MINIKIATSDDLTTFELYGSGVQCRFRGKLQPNSLKFDALAEGACNQVLSTKKFNNISIDKNGTFSMTALGARFPTPGVGDIVDSEYFGKCIKPIDDIRNTKSLSLYATLNK